MSVASSVTPLIGRELVELGVEPDVGDGGAGDRRQQGAAQRVAERVAEAGLERADGELLAVALLLADGLDRGTLDDEQSDTSGFVGFWGGGLLGVELDDELLAHGDVDGLPDGQSRRR